MFQHLQGLPAPPPPAPAGATVRGERELLKTIQNRSEPLKIAQNHSKSLKIAHNRSNPLQTDSKLRASGEFGVILGNIQSLLFEEP